MKKFSFAIVILGYVLCSGGIGHAEEIWDLRVGDTVSLPAHYKFVEVNGQAIREIGNGCKAYLYNSDGRHVNKSVEFESASQLTVTDGRHEMFFWVQSNDPAVPVQVLFECKITLYQSVSILETASKRISNTYGFYGSLEVLKRDGISTFP